MIPCEWAVIFPYVVSLNEPATRFADRFRDAVAEMLAQCAKNRAPISLNRWSLGFRQLGADSAFVSDRALSNLHDKPVTKAFAFIVSGICLYSMMRAVDWA